MQHHKTVAIIPAFNEEKTIKTVVSEAARYVDEVIVIDDGSVDATAILAVGAGAYVHSHSRNLCYGEAVKTGLRIALQQGATAAVILDGDGQHDPSYIPFVLKPVLDGSADIVVASRFIRHRKCIPFIRRMGISFVNFLFNRLYGSSLSDTQSGFRAFSSRAMRLSGLQEKGMGISIEVIAKAVHRGLIIREMPAPCKFNDFGHCNPALIAQGLTVIRAIIRHRKKCLRGDYHLSLTRDIRL